MPRRGGWSAARPFFADGGMATEEWLCLLPANLIASPVTRPAITGP
ncbi:hypothetical protein [Sphingomonas sp. LC-1]|jgi:hypothetical protein|nr:hypothetical protein [Sphingomonas sp. LC-1]